MSGSLISWADAGGSVDQHTAAPGLLSWNQAQQAPAAPPPATPSVISPAPVTSPVPQITGGNVGPQVRGRFGMVNLTPQAVTGAQYLGAANNAIDSATFGADRIIAPALDSPLIAAVKGESIPQAYTDIQNSMAASRTGLQQSDPSAAAAAQAVGAIVSPLNAVAAPLFASARAATLGGKALNAARNIGAGAALGGANAYGTSNDTGSQRLQDAALGADGGAGLAGAATAIPAIIGGVGKIVAPLTKTGPEAIAGRVLNEIAGTGPTAVETPALPGLTLNTAQATNNPAIAAQSRLQDAMDQNGAAARIAQQNAALRGAFVAPIGGAAPLSSGATMPAASASYADSVRTAQDLADQRESALWNAPALSMPVKTAPVVQAVQDAVKNLSPGEKLGLTGPMQAIVGALKPEAQTVSNVPNTGMPAFLRPLFPETTAVTSTTPGFPKESTVSDLNTFRSQILKFQRNPNMDPLQRLVAGKLADGIMTGMDALPEVQQSPEIAAAYQNARDFTRQSRQAFGFKPFQNVLAANAQGNQEANTGAAAGQMFDFAKGTPKNPEALGALNNFLTGLRQNYAAAGQMGNAAQATFAQQRIANSLRDYVAAAALDRASSVAPDASGAQKVMPNQLSDWINTNRPWLKTSGIFSDKQMAVLDRINQGAQQVGRQDNLRGTSNSTTYELLQGKRFIDAFLPRGAMTMGKIGAAAGAIAATHIAGFGELADGGAGLAALLGYKEGAEALQHLYEPARERVMELVAEAIRDPNVAADLMMKAKASNIPFMSPKTRGMIQAIIAGQGPQPAIPTQSGSTAPPQMSGAAQ